MRRPAGITFLAVLIYIKAAWLLALVVASLVDPKALDVMWLAFNHSTERASRHLSGPGDRVLFAVLFLAISVLTYFIARGFWRLKNWARVLVLLFTILGLPGETGSFLEPIPTLLSDRIIPTFWRHSYLVTSGILYICLSFLATLIVLGYLLTRPVRTAFLARPTEWRWLLAVGVLGLLSFAYEIYKSGSELNAVRYHLRYGDQVTVNGVTFPLYAWYAPKVDPEGPGFSIDDPEAGPLRPDRQKVFIYMTVEGYKENKNGLTTNDLVASKIQSYQKSGYKNLSTFQLQVAKQSLSCMNEHSYGTTVYCYGDGPIYSVFFTGGDEALTRFNQMMAEARQGP